MKPKTDRARRSPGRPRTPPITAPAGRTRLHAQLHARLVERRAIEGALWGMPLVAFDAMRQAYLRDAGARPGDVAYWSAPVDWRFQAPTPIPTTRHALFFVDLRDGPVVVELPPTGDVAIDGSLLDAWSLPLVDVGAGGVDQGRGGKYLLLTPHFGSPPPGGYIPIPAATYNVCGLLRLTPRHARVDAAAIDEHLKGLRIHPLASAATPPEPRRIDMAAKPFEAIARVDAEFYVSLARMVAEEPIKEQDLTIMGQLHAIGIGKGMIFQPDAATVTVLEHAIEEAHEFMVEGRRDAGFVWWPQGSWKFPVSDAVIRSGHTFLAGGRVLLDERAINFFGACGTSRNGPPGFHVETFVDAAGHALDGGRRYRLHVPPGVPARSGWSIAVYDTESAAFLRGAPVIALDSRDEKIARNPDGSVDVYFGPRAARSRVENWIATVPDRAFFVVFRNCDPERSVLARTSRWVLGELERVASGARWERSDGW